MSAIDIHRDDFSHVNGTVPPALTALRREALERFAQLGFPTTRLEDWKYTDVAPLAKSPLRLARESGVRITASQIAPLALATATQLVFVDGRFAPALSSRGALPRGVTVRDLASALAEDAARVAPHLARYAACDTGAFTALNTAFIQDGAFIHLGKGAVADEVIHLLFVATGSTPSIAHPRTLIVADEGSRVSVAETYAGLGSAAYCTNAVTEIALGPGAHVAHYLLQQEGAGAFHIATVQAHQSADSELHSHVVSLGGALARTDVNTVLDARGASCVLDGLYLAGDRQHVDHHTTIDHVRPHCSSRELYKGILDGHATGVFNGKVYVREDAQKSDAGQVNKNLLLSDSAIINTKPQLEIFADDVKCSHGATIGRLDEDALFFLRARGIGADEARRLLIHAFASEVVGRVTAAPVRARLEQLIGPRLHDDVANEGQP